jgi:hypothetical protein
MATASPDRPVGLPIPLLAPPIDVCESAVAVGPDFGSRAAGSVLTGRPCDGGPAAAADAAAATGRTDTGSPVGSGRDGELPEGAKPLGGEPSSGTLHSGAPPPPPPPPPPPAEAAGTGTAGADADDCPGKHNADAAQRTGSNEQDVRRLPVLRKEAGRARRPRSAHSTSCCTRAICKRISAHTRVRSKAHATGAEWEGAYSVVRETSNIVHVRFESGVRCARGRLFARPHVRNGTFGCTRRGRRCCGGRHKDRGVCRRAQLLGLLRVRRVGCRQRPGRTNGPRNLGGRRLELVRELHSARERRAGCRWRDRERQWESKRSRERQRSRRSRRFGRPDGL